jgi:hypothetical protein
MAVLAYLQEIEPGVERRASSRRRLQLEAPVGARGDRRGSVVIHNLSARGVLLESDAELSLGTEFDVSLPEALAARARVRWKNGRFFGCEFLTPISKAALSAALLKSPALSSADGRAAEQEFFAEAARGPPLGVRLWIILGLSIGAWALILALRLL